MAHEDNTVSIARQTTTFETSREKHHDRSHYRNFRDAANDSIHGFLRPLVPETGYFVSGNR